MSRQPVRAVFLGTPDAAVPSLRSLSAAAEVVAAITRPDKPKGRSGRPSPSPVKEAAADLGIAVLQPANSSELTDALIQVGAVDVGVVTAFGTLISPQALAIPARGFLNIHFSLLPRWRGAGPVVAAILAGDEETGVTLMNLDQGLDTGPIVAARQVVVGREETGGELTARLARIGAELLIENLHPWTDGTLMSTPQPGIGVTNAPKLTKADLSLDPHEPVEGLLRRIRALAPSPGAVLTVDDIRLRVLAGSRLDLSVAVGQITVVADRVLIGAPGGALELLIVQPPGKRPMPASAWMRGLRNPPSLTTP